MANIVAHGACGVKWTQIGNESGHCSGCHETFSGLRAFDMHQSIADGNNVCHTPADAGLVPRPDKSVPGMVVWGRKGSPPARNNTTPHSPTEGKQSE